VTDSRGLIGGLLIGLLFSAALAAEDDIPGTVRSTVGITRKETVIEALLPAGENQLDDPRLRVLLVGSLDGSAEAKAAVVAATRWFYTAEEAADVRKQISLAAIPCVNPDGLAAKTGPANGSGGNPSTGYPPQKGFYDSPTDPEAAYLWRWIGIYGPDFVFEIHKSDKNHEYPDKAGLIAALKTNAACDVGIVPGMVLGASADDKENWLKPLLAELPHVEQFRSACRLELARRQKREPLAVAQELAKVYGHKLDQVAYIPALAVIGRLRLGELSKDAAQRPDAERLLAPYLRGEKNPIPKNGSEQAGHLVFAEMARRTDGADRERYIALCRAAADQIFDESGKPLPLMPFNLEMSDAVFMAGPILCATGKLTGERKYFDAAAQHLAGMRKLCLRDDGIYRHSPLDESAWGRGNGFPALGVALCLSDLPEDHPARDELLKEFRAHMAALKKHQEASGCWRQVIDRPASYREFTATCMIGFSMLRGIDRGWLAREEYAEPVRRAWEAIKLRAGPEGKLVDVCTGTGKMKSLREYYDRPAILGRDDRGGAMGLLFSLEMLDRGAGL
jgi:unsaturated rhamnogalacturonyl hydrolase